MQIRIVYSDRARRSLLEIALHVTELNPDAALRVVDEIHRRLNDVLTVFPEAGPRVERENKFLTVRRHSVLYRFDPVKSEFVVLDLFGPGMDWR